MINFDVVNINNKKLSYLRINDWSDEVILFFHGFNGSKEYFPTSINTNNCILSFDRPGVGESSIIKYYKMEEFSEDVYNFLKQNNVKKVNLIGHSAGGYYAQVFAEMYPNFVSSVSLISSMVPLNSPKTKDIVGSQWKFITFLSLHAKLLSKFYFKMMSNGITKNYDKALAENMKTLTENEKEFVEDNYDLVKNSILSAVANKGLGVCYDSYALCQKREDVKIAKDIPVYVWHGTDDITLPINFTKYFEENYEVKNIHKIEKTGHMLYLIYWEDILNEISQEKKKQKALKKTK